MRTKQDYHTFLTNLQKVRQEASKKPQKKVSATQATVKQNEENR